MIRSLASRDEIAVAAPVLTGSRRLTTNDLVEIAQTKGQAHLLAISERSALEPAVTDILLDRGDRKVVAVVATNCKCAFFRAWIFKIGGKIWSTTIFSRKLSERGAIYLWRCSEIFCNARPIPLRQRSSLCYRRSGARKSNMLSLKLQRALAGRRGVRLQLCGEPHRHVGSVGAAQRGRVDDLCSGGASVTN